MNKAIYSIVFLLTVVLSLPHELRAEVKSRYVTLRYDDNSTLLNDFNNEFILTRKLRYYFLKKKAVTVEDQVLAKLDIVIEKVETVLNMFPANLHIVVVLLPTSREVAAIYKDKYYKKVNYIAYYSLSENTIYVSVNDASLGVIAHEIGHAIVDHHFTVRPGYETHELMATFAEDHIND